MKAVLISIQPKYVEKIASGEKTIEVRKTRPKLEVPFKCYIYMSQGTYKDLGTYSDWIYENRMRVIGEFVCDRIVGYYPYGLRGFELSNEVLKNICLSNKDLNEYGKLDRVYGWHISDLKIYDEPKDLSEFNHYKKTSSLCDNKCGICDCISCNRAIKRPPQSWFYIEGE